MSSFDTYVKKAEGIKLSRGQTITNNFISPDLFKNICETRNGLVYEYPGCVFAAIQRHNMFYQLFYHAADIPGLSDGLSRLPVLNMPVTCQIAGKEACAEEFVPVFSERGYALRKRNRRYIRRHIKPTIELKDSTAEYAKGADAEELLEMLLDYFDIYSDRVPELEEVRENAEKGQIAIVRSNGKIAALDYYEFHKGICHTLFIYSRPEFRRTTLVHELRPLVIKALNGNPQKINQIYSWRDIDNPALSRIAARLEGEMPQDMVIYTFKGECL